MAGQVITAQLLRNLFVAFKTNYQAGFAGVAPTWSQIATEIPSTTAANEYGWFDLLPSLRLWVGDRFIHRLKLQGYRVVNDDWEMTFGVKRPHIEDDNLGIYKPIFTEQGRSAAVHPDELVYDVLGQGFDAECFDGQPFFDQDHPVIAQDGSETVYSNFQGGSGRPWYLMDTSRALRPLVFQVRKRPEFVAKDALTDDNVFHKNEFVYGVDCRDAGAYGLPQLAYASRNELTSANYAAARAAMIGLKGTNGKRLGINPTLLVVGPDDEERALEIVKAERKDGGASNVWAGSVKVLMSSYVE